MARTSSSLWPSLKPVALCVLLLLVDAEAGRRGKQPTEAVASATAWDELLGFVTAGDWSAAMHALPGTYGRWWISLLRASPWHVAAETTLLLFVCGLLLTRMKSPKSLEEKLSAREVDELCAEWTPEPLARPLSADAAELLRNRVVVEQIDGATMRVTSDKAAAPSASPPRGRPPPPQLDLSRLDFLGLGQRPEPKADAKAALQKYGCGSCGPRGFYGTIDVHVQLEQQLASFLGVADSIAFSDSASTLTSTVAAFAKRGDLIVADERCNEALLIGVKISRAKVVLYKHNDMGALEAALEEVARADAKLGRDPALQRRFIVAEGLYRNTGAVLPLGDVVALKNKYKFRLILDESCSFGVLGDRGRGLSELCGIAVSEIDILCVSLDHALGAVGGACVGSREMVDAQRLSGAGYCYSASAPPFFSSAALAALRLLDGAEGDALRARLRVGTAAAAAAIRAASPLVLLSDERSPIVHVGIAALASNGNGGGSGGSDAAAIERASKMLVEIELQCRAAGVSVTTTKYLPAESATWTPSIRLAVSAVLTPAELEKALMELTKAATAVCGLTHHK